MDKGVPPGGSLVWHDDIEPVAVGSQHLKRQQGLIFWVDLLKTVVHEEIVQHCADCLDLRLISVVLCTFLEGRLV